MASYVDWIWYRIINGLSWKQFSSPQLAGFLLIFPSNSVEGDKRPSVHCHLMAFWPPSDPVGLPGTWIQVMKRMPNTMKCHEMPWNAMVLRKKANYFLSGVDLIDLCLLTVKGSVSLPAFSWLSYVFSWWGCQHISWFANSFTSPEAYMMALNDSLAAKALPWHWDQRRLKKTSDGEPFYIIYRVSLWRRIMFHKADLYLWSMKLGRPGLGCYEYYEWARSTLFLTYRIGCFFHGPMPGKSRWASLHRNWKRSDTTWGARRPWHRWDKPSEKPSKNPWLIFNRRQQLDRWMGRAPSFDIFLLGRLLLVIDRTVVSYLENCHLLFKQFSKNSVGWWFGGLNHGDASL